jgi:hypothetical protein
MPKATGSRSKCEWEIAKQGTVFWVGCNNPRSMAQSLRRWANKRGYWYDYLVSGPTELIAIVYGPNKPDNPIDLREAG